MAGWDLSPRDRHQIEERGISVEEALWQLRLIERGTPFPRVVRPCTRGDGIASFSDDERDRLAGLFETGAAGRGVTQFIPASGAASRMFKTLIRFNNASERIPLDTIEEAARGGDEESLRFLLFARGVRRFAFFEDLASVMAAGGLDADALIEAGEFKEIVDYLLTEKGLAYAGLPKALIKFHRYPEGSRTAFEEHLAEAAGYAREGVGLCRIHFTVSSRRRESFRTLLRAVRPRWESRLGVRFHVDFSVQSPATDTIAADLEGRPFRLNDGSILFRPAGHGALVANLKDLGGDIVFIRNVDNVATDKRRELTALWKKVLGGCLIRTQTAIFSHLEKLEEGCPSEGLLEEAFRFAERALSLVPPDRLRSASLEKKREFLIRAFSRPLRVCGMVPNAGEPGGGPFWVRERDGALSRQIVEKGQIDFSSEGQRSAWEASTHFNPVDIVCGLRDRRGRLFELAGFVDENAVSVTRKSREGRDLKALELPGLWNGGMAHWNTLFVEVPAETFNPVKTVNDLLRDAHQYD